MIIAYSRKEYPDEVLNLFCQMILEGVRTDNAEKGVEGDGVVIVGLTQASANLEDLIRGRSVHGHLILKDLPIDVVAQTSLWICMPRMDI